MKLSKEDQALLDTDFGELDKVAAEQVKVAQSMLDLGASYAESFADQMEKAAADAAAKEGEEGEKEDEEEKLDEESEKKASDLSMFVERTFFDTLVKEGSANGNSLLFLAPYVEQAMHNLGVDAETVKVAMEVMLDNKDEQDLSKVASDVDGILSVDTEGMDKEAAEQVNLVKTATVIGTEYAAASIEQMVESVKMASVITEDMDKTAHDMSLFVERGFVEKLAALGTERYQDEFAYITPLVMEKVAFFGTEKARESHAAKAKSQGTLVGGAYALGRYAKKDE